MDDLLAVHEQSLDDKLPRNTVSYNALLTSLLKHGEHDVMTEIFKSMTKDYMRDCKPDATTMSLLLKAATTSGDVSNLNFVWRYARLSNLVDWYIVGIMADMLAAVSISSPQKRQELLKLLHDYVRVAQGSKQRAPLRQQTCRTIIASAVVLADSLEELAKLVRQLQKYADDTTDVSREAIISVTSHDATRIRNGLKPRAAGTRIAQLLNRDRTVEDDVMVMKSTSQPDQANLAAKTKVRLHLLAIICMHMACTHVLTTRPRPQLCPLRLSASLLGCCVRSSSSAASRQTTSPRRSARC